MKKRIGLFAALAIGIASATAQAQEFKVGVQYSLTGATALAGNEMYRGVQVAAEAFNQRHSDKIKLVVIDDESIPEKAVAAIEKLASQNVVALFGSTTSTLAGPASIAAQKAGLVYCSSGGTSDDMVSRGLNNFFRISNNRGYASGMVGLFSEMGVKSVSVIYSTKESTLDLAKKVAKSMEQKGVKVVMHPFDASINDFKPILHKVKTQDRSEGIAMIGYENDYVGILRAAKVIKPNVKAMVGAWALATPKMVASFPTLLPNVYGSLVLPFPADENTAAMKTFKETYVRLFKTNTSNYHSQSSYVMGQILFEAIERAYKKGTLAKGLADEIRSTKHDDTLLGRVTFSSNGDNPNYVAHMGQFQSNGTISVVWPKKMATAKMKYPSVPW